MMLDVTEEIQPMSMNGLLLMESLIHLVNNMLPITMHLVLVNQMTSAKIALGHHVQKDKTAKMHVGPLTTRNITFLSIMDSLALKR
jgi:hypothetical protein